MKVSDIDIDDDYEGKNLWSAILEKFYPTTFLFVTDRIIVQGRETRINIIYTYLPAKNK